MASTTQDDGFHEIQLNGKQLVFLFMAVTVVSVVIFLSGVLVGRGVRMASAPVTEAADPRATEEQAPPPPVESGNTPINREPDLKASGMLGGAPPAEPPLRAEEEPTAKPEPIPEPAPEPTAPPEKKPPAEAPRTSPAPAPAGATTSAVATAPSAPAGKGFEIQLSAFRDRKGADALASRLIALDFPAYVVPPSEGAPPLFRVRVGKFKERREADAAASRLKKEKFEPWILP
jgi:cell division septation protein DedD